MKSFTIKLIKVVLYLTFVGAAVVYTPKLLSKALGTPYPMATITSGSMWPALKTNDLIFMKGVSGKEAQVNDIVIFKNPQGFTIHRLIRREKNGQLITKGDANNTEDVPINESDVIGRIVYIGDTPFRIPGVGVIARNLSPKINNLMSK